MPRGGARPGAGRKRKSEAPGGTPTVQTVAQVGAGQMTPLEYMLAVVNDVSADISRRDRMAQAAAPYVHPRAEAEALGKKAQRQTAAQTAERGTDWESLLGPRN